MKISELSKLQALYHFNAKFDGRKMQDESV